MSRSGLNLLMLITVLVAIAMLSALVVFSDSLTNPGGAPVLIGGLLVVALGLLGVELWARKRLPEGP